KYFITIGENNNSYAIKIAKNLKDLLASERTKENIEILDSEVLHPKAISVKVTDLETKESILYDSFRKAAKGLNTDPKTVRKYARLQKPLLSRYLISLKEDINQNNTTEGDELGS